MLRVLTVIPLAIALLFTSARADTTSPEPNKKGELTGVWTGEFKYPADSDRDPVKFQLVLIQDGKTIAGFMKEPNTFGKRKDEPYLHAVIKGTFDAKTGKIKFTKTYDGTGGESHDVAYEGKLEKSKVDGTWKIDDYGGKFTMEKKALDKKTLEILK